jgi:hypothetical protein
VAYITFIRSILLQPLTIASSSTTKELHLYTQKDLTNLQVPHLHLFSCPHTPSLSSLSHLHYFHYPSINLYTSNFYFSNTLLFIDNTTKGSIFCVTKWFSIEFMDLLLLNYTSRSVHRNDSTLKP